MRDEDWAFGKVANFAHRGSEKPIYKADIFLGGS
jgi:hypothetical protein